MCISSASVTTDMDAAKATIIRTWLERSRESRGMIQEDVSNAMVSAGWKMTRDRYSKYESGALPIGPTVYANFVAYWASQGVTAPELNPPPASELPLDPMERIALAVESIAETLAVLRTDMAGQSGSTIGAVQNLGAKLTATLEGMRASL